MSSGAPQEKGISIRYPSTALFCVDSADAEIFDPASGLRLNNPNPAQIYINKQRPLMFGYMTRLALTEVNLQWEIPNVNDFNGVVYVGLVNETLQIEDVVAIDSIRGFYTLPGLVKALIDAMNSNTTITEFYGTNTPFSGEVGGFDVSTGQASTTVSVQNPYVHIKLETSTENPYFTFIPYNSSLLNGYNVKRYNEDLLNMLGLTQQAVNGAQPYYTIIDGSYASTQYTPYVDIVSNILTKNQNVADGTSQKSYTVSKLARVYLSQEGPVSRQVTITYGSTGAVVSTTDNAIGTKPFVLYREFQTPKQIQWNSTENVDVVDLSVLDYKGQTLYFYPGVDYIEDPTEQQLSLANTSDFQFTIQVTEV